MRSLALAALLATSLASAACSTYHDNLARGQRAFEQNEHERALAILRDLDADQRRFSPEERARYTYLRGMTDYRIGYRAEARHWLLLARALDDATDHVLPNDWRARTDEALKDLDAQVYESGVASLTNERTPTEAADLKK